VPLMIIVVLFIGGIAVNQYLFLYMTTYALTILKLPATFAMLAPILSGITGAVGGIYGGWAAYRYGLNVIKIVPRAIMMIVSFPAFYFVNDSGNGWVFLAVVSVLSILHMASTALLNMVVAEAFPADIRAVGVSTTYALALSIFGGTAQFIVTGVIAITGDPRAIAWAFIGSSLLSMPLTCLSANAQILTFLQLPSPPLLLVAQKHSVGATARPFIMTPWEAADNPVVVLAVPCGKVEGVLSSLPPWKRQSWLMQPTPSMFVAKPLRISDRRRRRAKSSPSSQLWRTKTATRRSHPAPTSETSPAGHIAAPFGGVHLSCS